MERGVTYTSLRWRYCGYFPAWQCRKIKAILDDRGWLLYNTLVAVTGDSAGDLNNASVDAYFHAVFGPPGYMWPQDSELTHEAVQNDLYTAREQTATT